MPSVALMNIQRSEHEGGVRLLRIDRPPANAINTEFLSALFAEMEACEADPAVRAVVVGSAARFFSAGLDLKEIMAKGPGQMAALGGAGDGIYRLWRLPKPTIAMVEGHALAGGAILMLACDFRIAVRGSYRIGVTESALGLPLPNGAFQIARYALPPQHHHRVLLEGEGFGPERALELGLIHELVEPAAIEARCLALAAKLGAYPESGYGYQKAKLQAEANRALVEPPPLGTDRFEATGLTPEVFARLMPAKI